MSYGMEYPMLAAQAPASERAAFIRRTYGHLAAAILAFVGLEYILLQIPGLRELSLGMMSNGIMWLVVLGAFMGVSYLASSWARSDTSPGIQYAGLGLYVVAEAVIFLPLLAIASMFYPGVIQSAAIMTLSVFAGLSLAVLITGKDFSFLGPIIAIASLLSLGFIVAAIFIPSFNMGLIFCFFMVALASASILYNTSNLLHQYRTDQHVAAALSLFASVALLFWYVLQILMMSDRR